MRQSVILSSIVHVAILVVLFAVRANARLIVPGPDVVQVALIEPGAVRVPTPPPVTRAPEPVRERLTPQEEVGVKVSPPPVKKRAPEPEPQPKEAPLPAPALTSVAIGPPGLSGSVAVDAGDFEFTYYLVIVRNRIAQNWTPPAGLVTGGQPLKGVVYFRIARGGAVSNVRVESQSGHPLFDHSTQRAIQLSNPMPPLPLGFPGSDLGVHFGFEYATP